MKFFSPFSIKGFGQFEEERIVGFEPQIWSKDENLIIKKIVWQQNPAKLWLDIRPDLR